ncbi:hypothetical protein J1614_007774 [Plenodomus biglobosus]|nr:hypothetical protein J1614_007774 [Plenodomus biglobosus]
MCACTAVTGTCNLTPPLEKLCEYQVNRGDVGFLDREVEVSHTRGVSRAVPRRDVIQGMVPAHSLKKVDYFTDWERRIAEAQPVHVTVFVARRVRNSTNLTDLRQADVNAR